MEVSTLPRRGGGYLPHPRQVLKAFGDDRLVEQIRRGNEAAFEVAYERHHRGILSFCRHMLSSQEEAEDAVQQTFVSAFYDMRASDKEIKLKPWLYTIARNRCLTVLRARREQPAELDDIPTAGLASTVQQREDLRRMLADVRGLAVEQRAALVLSELGDLSHTEIGDVLGCPTLKVKSLVFQARSSLIESRDARETSCVEIREQLSTLRGGALRRGSLRKHLNVCPGCREFREEVRRQRAAIALILPVVPTAGLKGGVMSAISGGGAAAGGGVVAAGGGSAVVAGGGVAVGGSAGVGGVVSLLASAGTTEVAIAAIIATGVVGGTAVIATDGESGRPASGTAASAKHGTAGGSSSSATSIRKTPAASLAPGTKAKKDKTSKDPAVTLILNPDGTITAIPSGDGDGDGGGSGGGGGSGKAKGGGKGSENSKGAGRQSYGNSNGTNGTRTRAHGNPSSKGGKGKGKGHGTTPAPQAAPDVAPPATSPPHRGPKGGKGTRGGKGPKLPDLPLP